jgi:hypothetical protein
VRPGWLETLKAALREPHRLAWASPFLAGVVAGGLVIALVTGILGPRVRTDLPVTGMLPLPERGAVLDRQELRLAEARVTFTARRVAGGVAVEFSPAVASPVELVLEFAPAALRPVGLEWRRPGGHRAALAPGRVWLRIAADGEGTLLLAPAGAGDTPIGLTMRSAAGSAQGTLHTAAPGRGR